MTTSIVSIVEGRGEVDAVPILLRRTAARSAPSFDKLWRDVTALLLPGAPA